jgi:excinuclease UvrABC nuclease subunit
VTGRGWAWFIGRAIQRVSFTFFATETSEALAFLAGEIDRVLKELTREMYRTEAVYPGRHA